MLGGEDFFGVPESLWLFSPGLSLDKGFLVCSPMSVVAGTTMPLGLCGLDSFGYSVESVVAHLSFIKIGISSFAGGDLLGVWLFNSIFFYYKNCYIMLDHLIATNLYNKIADLITGLGTRFDWDVHMNKFFWVKLMQFLFIEEVIFVNVFILWDLYFFPAILPFIYVRSYFTNQSLL